MKHHVASLLFATGLAVILAAPASTLASPQDTAQASCKATISSETVSEGDSEAEVSVDLSQAVGAVESARIDPASGVHVTAIEAEDSTHLVLHLDLTAASEGAWEITLVGEAGICSGSLEIGGSRAA